ncbi:MAG: hypothetical protein HY518_03020 [Candidatus Aenigmarchaeota archaeon]|nr:hypothetical protein [Candidatus Aenigmarchaeota archaeon]
MFMPWVHTARYAVEMAGNAMYFPRNLGAVSAGGRGDRRTRSETANGALKLMLLTSIADDIIDKRKSPLDEKFEFLDSLRCAVCWRGTYTRNCWPGTRRERLKVFLMF